jgi:hypothetical protein
LIKAHRPRSMFCTHPLRKRGEIASAREAGRPRARVLRARTTCRAEWRAWPGRAGCPSPQSAGAAPHTPRRRSCPAPAACARRCRTRPRGVRWKWAGRRGDRRSATPCSTCRCSATARQPGARRLRATRGGHAPVHPGASAEDVVALLAHEREAAHPAHNLGAGALVHLNNLVRRQQVVPAARATRVSRARARVRQVVTTRRRYRGFSRASRHAPFAAKSVVAEEFKQVQRCGTLEDGDGQVLSAAALQRVAIEVAPRSEWVEQLMQSVRVRAARGPGDASRATAAQGKVLTEPRARHRRGAAQRAERSRHRRILRK